MQKEDIKSGFLQVPPSTWLQLLLNKPWVKKQCVLYPASHQGVKRLEVFDLAPSLRRREPAGLIIPLGDCVKIAEEHIKGKDFVFSVVTREGSHTFSAGSIQELHDWVDALQRIAFGKAGSDCPNSKLLSASRSLPGEQCDDNVLYGSVENRSTFPVTVEENEMTLRLRLSGPHVVQVAAASVQLRTVGGQLRASWLFSHIRRYGQTRDSFVMEVGRSSETGPGSFIFRTRAAGALQHELQRVMAEYEHNRHSAAPDLPTSPPPPQPPPPPPAAPFESHTLDRLSSGRKGKKTPIAKPPRKTKATATAEDVLPNVVPLAEKQWLLTQSLKMTSPEQEKAQSNELLLGSLSVPFMNEPEEEMYSEPGERRSAWRELGRDVEHVEHSAPADRWDVAVDGDGLAEPLRPTPVTAGERSSASYASLQHMPCSTEAPGAQYARLGEPLGASAGAPLGAPGLGASAKAPGAENRTAAWAAEQSLRKEAAVVAAAAAAAAAPPPEKTTSNDAPIYANVVPAPAWPRSSPGSEIGSGSQKGATSHVIVNDEMYTLLDKPRKNGS